ncbi:MAG TPA: hypothetical protein VHZ73_02400 [Vicinamibacterales bacterium]|nr:hypothetical protein [Vicinamibacterales bacterium]
MIIFRSALASSMIVAAAIEPALTPPDMDFTRYAMTQGGLLVVVLVLLWGIRRELTGKDSQITVLTQLVKDSTQAQTSTADALDRVSRAVEVLTDRRVNPR